MTPPVLRVGTRGSALALAQSGQVATAIVAAMGFGTVELVRIRTEGDVNTGALAAIGGTGVFVTAVRDALRSGEVDLVVHSFKDLPTATAEGIALRAVPVRADPADALCARDGLTLAQLPRAAKVGTGSPRRMAQILSLRSDLDVVPVRGNVHTRLARVGTTDLDAVMLAAAGLRRLGLAATITEQFDPTAFLPAPAQGALAVECRAGDSPWFAAGLAAIDDSTSRWAAIAERAVLAGLEAGCSAPVSALARVDDGAATMAAQVTAADGSSMLRRTVTARVADDVNAAGAGQLLAAELLAAGAAGLMGSS
ncbi:MAG: hydroxymethylbilane synthase [Actinomycetota bacterium]|nr:hydroxymethylbilane synthase [Actinomycetota bacterium]